jgi:thiamine-phosphate pyrophosphorylase
MLTLEGAARRLKPAGVPRLWLLSDATRLPDPRPLALRLPPGAAVLARDLTPALLRPLAALCRARRLALLVAGEGRLALRLGAGLHLPDRRPTRGLLPFLLARRPRALLSVAAHGRAGITRGRRIGAGAVLLSPAFASASHPGAPGLGPLRFAALARRVPPRLAVVALGGLTGPRAARLPRRVAGLAAIGGWAGAGR